MYQKPTVPRSIGGVLDDTLQLYKFSLPSTWLPSLLVSLMTAAVGYVVLSAIPLTPATLGPAELLARYQGMFRAFGLVYLVATVVSLVFYGMMTSIVAAVSRGERPTFGASLMIGLRRAPALFVASVVFCISIVVGFILLVIPGFYVWNRLELYLVPLVAESKGPFESLGTSWRLVGGNWWRTATVLFVMFVILIVLEGLLSTLVISIVGFGGLTSAAAANPVQALARVQLVTMLVGALVRIFTVPLIFAALVALYQDLQLRKGGGDLEARLGALPKA